MLFLLAAAVAVSLALFANIAHASDQYGLTNAERFKRSLPPLPPRNLASHHKRYIHPLRQRNTQAACPSNTPPPSCSGNCGYLSVIGASAPYTNYGYVYPKSGTQFGVTPCPSAASLFIFPGATDGFFTITQNTPANSDDYPLFGVGGPDHAGTFGSGDYTDILFLTSTDQDDPADVQPNADSPVGGQDAESTVWLWGNFQRTIVDLYWTVQGMTDASDPTAMTVVYDATANVLRASSDPVDYIANSPDTIAAVTLTVQSL